MLCKLVSTLSESTEREVSMFEAGEYIIYGTKGVCKVEAVGPISIPGVDRQRLYYTLTPVYDRSGTIYTPVENPKVSMRSIISREETLALIDEIPSIETLWIANEKEREQLFQKALLSCDCREAVKIIKTLYQKKIKRQESGKTATALDQKYLLYAQEQLYGEFAIALGMDKNQVEAYIIETLEKNVTE